MGEVIYPRQAALKWKHRTDGAVGVHGQETKAVSLTQQLSTIESIKSTGCSKRGLFSPIPGESRTLSGRKTTATERPTPPTSTRGRAEQSSVTFKLPRPKILEILLPTETAYPEPKFSVSHAGESCDDAHEVGGVGIKDDPAFTPVWRPPPLDNTGTKRRTIPNKDLLKFPSYVRACDTGAWHLKLERISTGETFRVPFNCRSWRHAGECRKWKGAQDFVRIKEGVSKYSGDWVYVVLTLPGHDHKKAWEGDIKQLHELYRDLYYRGDKLRKRLTRLYGKIKYITLVERHKSGVPHMNMLIHNEKLAEAASGEGWKDLRLPGSEFHKHVEGSGFGEQVWVEPVKNEEAMSGYLVKLLLAELTGADSKGQTPVEAPGHFRRLRASQGLLPPPHSDPDLTGQIVKKSIAEYEAEEKRKTIVDRLQNKSKKVESATTKECKLYHNCTTVETFKEYVVKSFREGRAKLCKNVHKTGEI